jgi:hypothetical protein
VAVESRIERDNAAMVLLFCSFYAMVVDGVDGWRELAGGETGVIIDDSIKPIKTPK